MCNKTPYETESIKLEYLKSAEEFLERLPSDPHYLSGELVYPPRGLGDIANLMAAFHQFSTQWRH